MEFDFANVARSFRSNLIGSILTSLMLFVLVSAGYVGYYAVTTGTPISDIVTSKQMKLVSRSNGLIDDALALLLANVPTAARARISVIHNGSHIWTQAQIPLFKGDTMWAKANPGYQPLEMTINTPLSMWSDFLPLVLDGKCGLFDDSQLKNDWLRSRMEALNVAAFAACPIISLHGEMLGVLFLSFSDLHRVPENRDEMFAAMRSTAGLVTGYLELRL